MPEIRTPISFFLKSKSEIQKLKQDNVRLTNEVAAHKQAKAILDEIFSKKLNAEELRVVCEVQTGLADLKKKESDTQIKLAEIKASLDMMKTMFTLAGTLLTVVGILGITNTIQVYSVVTEAKQATLDVNGVRNTGAKVAQDLTVYSIDNLLESQESFDSIHKNPAVLDQLNLLGGNLTSTSSRVEGDDRTTYTFVMEALKSYNDKDYVEALKSLNKVAKEDQKHFVYAYMKGVSMLRVGEPADKAEKLFELAASWSQGRPNLQKLAKNGIGICQLHYWKQTHDPISLNKAIGTYKQLISAYRGAPTIYFNYALSLAQDPNRYAEATKYLKLASRSQGWSLDLLVDYIQDDVLETREQFLKTYVEDYLGIKSDPTNDREWKEQMVKALKAEFQKFNGA